MEILEIIIIKTGLIYMQTIHFIVNPTAKNGYSLQIWNELEQMLNNKGVSYTVYFTEYPGHAGELAKEIADSLAGVPGLIAVVGGDGTLHEAVNGIIGRENIKIADIPAGSGNDFSRGLQLPLDPSAALEGILRKIDKQPFLMDVGKVATGGGQVHYFVNNFGAGFDAEIAYKVNRSRLKKFFNRFSLGTIVYVYFLISVALTLKRANVLLTVDDKRYEFQDTWLVNVSNHPYIGGGMKLAPDAVVNDGLLDITVIHQISRIKLLLLFVTVFWGGHKKFKEVSVFRGKNITIRSSEKMVLHADGEYIGETPVEVRLLPGKLAVVK